MGLLTECNIQEQYNPLVVKAKRIQGIKDYRKKASVEFVLLHKTEEQKKEIIKAIGIIRRNIEELFNQPSVFNSMEVLEHYCKWSLKVNNEE